MPTFYLGAAPTLTNPLPAGFVDDAVGIFTQVGPMIGAVLIAVIVWNVTKMVLRKASKLGK